MKLEVARGEVANGIEQVMEKWGGCHEGEYSSEGGPSVVSVHKDVNGSLNMRGAGGGRKH